MPGSLSSLFETISDDRYRAERQLVDQQLSVDFDTKEYIVEILVHKFQEKDLYIPSYQRSFVWTDGKQSKFIESLLLGLPIPFMFGADTEATARIEIVNGAQRLYTLHRFLDNELPLVSLEKLTFLSDFRFADLSSTQRRRFKNRTIRMVVLSHRTDLNTRFDIFERINTGSLRLEPSELRKGAFPGPFYEFIEECAELPEFQSLCLVGARPKKRGELQELLLRFFAYAERYRSFQHDVARFLNDYLVDKNRAFDRNVKETEFRRMLAFVKRYLPHGFAKGLEARSTPRVRFEAISVGVHLALCERSNLHPRNSDWLESDEFRKQTTTHASNSAPRLRRRVEFVRDYLLGTV